MTRSPRLQALAAWPRTRLGVTPTPFVPARGLGRALGRAPARTWLKLDDYTGFALGGNKVRKLETELSADRLDEVDTLITCGGVQSNHARVAAAAAAHLGLECVLVINGPIPDPPTGNARLHRLLTPNIVQVKDREDRDPAMERVRREVEDRGGRPLVVPLGASTGRGALGYALAMVELAGQVTLADVPGPRLWIFVAASSGGTLAGMLLGRALLGWDRLTIVAVSADDPPHRIEARATEQARAAARWIDFRSNVSTDGLTVTDAYVGDGYGIPSAASRKATRTWARAQGIVLDPTYTAKAAAGLVDWVSRERVPAEDDVVFWHTGGHPALFA